MTFQDEAKALLKKLPGPPGEELPRGISDEQLDECEKRLGLGLPEDFRDWLRHSNGPCVGPGGMVGIGTQRQLQDIETILELYPIWKQNKWIPIAGDGCGNYYVIIAEGENGGPVGFIDVAEDYREPAFVVGSDLWRFLVFLFRKELGESRWPFDRDEVESMDPEITQTGYVLPWNA